MPAAKTEFAPGIPDKSRVAKIPTAKTPREWEYGVHHHLSEGAAGEHFDLRLGDPRTGKAHSWALRYLPKPGETRLAVQQPTHTVQYMDFQGRIPEGYGKGQVDLAQRDKAEILTADDSHVRFNVYKGKGADEYLMRRTQKGWFIRNVTPHREVGQGKLLPTSKRHYGVVHPDQISVEDPNTELQAKIDGAHALVQFKDPGTKPRIMSYRRSKTDPSAVIDYTNKFLGFHKLETPTALKGTVVRAEAYAVDAKGQALPAARVGGILNANVWKSREMQQQEGRLQAAVIDIDRFKGKDVSQLPWSEKKDLIQQVVQHAPWLKMPRTATTESEKKKLLDDIAAGREPSTREGVVEWHADKPVPKKSKFLEERDVYVQGVFPETGPKRAGTMAGGFEISLSPKGPVVGRVGTGFSHGMKKHMLDNPGMYQGLKMRVLTERGPEHYAPRAPRFVSFHLDQDLPEGVKTAQKARGFYKGKPASPDTVKFTTDFQGIAIKVDRPKGFVMKGEDEKGVPWERVYKYDYGFIPKTLGGDGDGLDVFIGPDKNAHDSYWAVQSKPDGSFDEYKVFLGFPNRDAASSVYQEHIPKKLLKSLMTIKVQMMKAMLGLDTNGLIHKEASLSHLAMVEELRHMGFQGV